MSDLMVTFAVRDEFDKLRAENQRLRTAKRAAAAIADERSKENVALRAALQFIQNLAREGYTELRQSAGNEIVLRHIIKRTVEALEQGATKDG